MATTTVERLRDHMIALLGAASPTVLVGDRFEAHDNERDGDFQAWALAAAAGALRRFQIRDVGDDQPPSVSSDVEWREMTFEVTLAYPQTSRAGADAALDRDDVMRADQELVEALLGMRGQGNFCGDAPHASWLGSDTVRAIGDGVDFLIIRQRMGFWQRIEPAPVGGAVTSYPTTIEAIRGHILSLIEALIPEQLEHDRFERFLNEGASDFVAATEAAGAGALRRFQVRDLGSAGQPDTSAELTEGRFVILQVEVAYPQTSRSGADNALDRDDLMRADQLQIERTIGLAGGANFTGPTAPNASWVDGSTARVIGNGIDYLVIRQTMRFQRTYP